MLHVRRLLLVSLVGGLAGCNALLSHPGNDFAVTVQSEMPLVVTQRVEPVELVFEVTGCTDFETSIGTVTTGGSVTTALEPVRRADGLYVAKVPVQAVATAGDCRSTVEDPSPSYKRLTILCRDEHRQAVADVEISYAPAFKSFYSGRGPVDTVLPGREPGTFFTVGSGWLSYFGTDDDRSVSDAVMAVEPDTRPRLVQQGDTVYLWAGCPLDDCGLSTIETTPAGSTATSATYLIPFRFDAGSGRVSTASAPIPVPSTVVGMTALPSGGVALLSSLANTVLLTFVGSRAVSRIQKFEGEESPTDFARLGDALVFLTATTSGSSVRMRAADGALRGEYPLDGAGEVTFLSLAPSGNQWVYARSGEVRLGSVGADGKALPTRTLETKLGADKDRFGATWLTNHIGLWNSLQDAAPELHARSEGPPPVAIELAAIRGRSTSIRTGLGLDHAFVVVTPSGVEMFDEQGHSLGGADPFDSSCGRQNFFGGEVTALDGETIAVGGTSYVSLFRPRGAR